jgi:hypothetical protein
VSHKIIPVVVIVLRLVASLLAFPPLYKRSKELFAWMGLKSTVKKFVVGCHICQQAKPESVLYPGLFQTIHIPTQA